MVVNSLPALPKLREVLIPHNLPNLIEPISACDVWFPVLAPSTALLKRKKRSRTMDYRGFCASYERELLANTEKRQALDLLATFALRIPISIGCYCEDESQCHRSHLRKLIERTARKL